MRAWIRYVCLLLMNLPTLSVAGEQPPNIVLILADQLRFDASFSSGSHATPNLDTLAQRGACFMSAYTSTPSCTPARAALLSGKSPWNHGMLGYGTVASEYSADLSQILKRAGYETVSIGKNHFGWNETTQQGIPHGYETMILYDGLTEFQDDYYRYFKSILPSEDPMATGLDWNDWKSHPYVFNESMHPTSWTGRETLSYLRNRTENRPLFLKVSFHRPHSPYDAPQRWLNKVNRSALEPPVVGGNWDFVYHANATGCGGKSAWCGSFDLEEVMNTRAAYLANVMMADEWIGTIRQEILKLYPNTYFLLTSDHGDMQGEHNLWRKGYPYEGSSHIPMIMEWPTNSMIPEKLRGSKIKQVVELRDVMPTMTQIAGIENQSENEMDGKSMLCLLSTDPCSWRPYLDLEHSIVYNETVHWNALTDGIQKYIFRAFFADEQLFDLTQDPKELNNLVGDPKYRFDLELWRGRMVEQFRHEDRGPAWVQNGILQRRPEGQLYNSNYPDS